MPDDQSPPPTGTPGPTPVLPSEPVSAPQYPPAMPPWSSPAPPPPWGAPPPPPLAGGRQAPGWRPKKARSVAALATLVVLAAAAALGGWLSTRGSSTGATATSTSARQAGRLVSGALDAARAAGSFHYVSSSTSSAVTQLTVGDAGATAGRQVITLGGDTFNVLVVGSAAYFEGDAAAMVENLSVPISVAQAHAGQWVSLASGDAPYASVYAAVTTSDALRDNITFTPRTELGTSTLAGQRVIGVRGSMKGIPGATGKGTAVLYMSATGRHLPVRYVERGTLKGSDGSATSLQFSIDFSAWGEPVPVTAPPGALSFASLGTAGGGTGPPNTLVT